MNIVFLFSSLNTIRYINNEKRHLSVDIKMKSARANLIGSCLAYR